MKRGLALLGAVLVHASAGWALLSDVQKCTSAYLEAGGNHTKCLFQARDKAQRTGRPADYSRCEQLFAATWSKAQTRWGAACPASQWAGVTRRFVDNGDGTVTDNLTGLVWEEKTNKDGIANLADPHDADNRYALSSNAAGNPDGSAFTNFLATLNTTAFAGHTDWRLPTVVELRTILASPFQCSVGPPCVDAAFNNGTSSYTQSGYYWSSSFFTPSVGFAWFVNFNGGAVNLSSTTFQYGVRAVRGGF